MSDYIVSALKYRPQNFDTVIGQEHITTTLKNALAKDQLAHSFLFCGPRGVGKTSTARILAKVINCENLSEDALPCDQCPSCEAFDSNTSYNVYELDAASNNSVEDIRHLIDGVRFAPQRGKYKVYIIDEVHMLSNQAFNAFLKTLEEPPSHAIFILATTEKHKILPTILSRCQIFDFRRISTTEVMGHLREICETEDVDYDEDSLQVIAQKSEGCMRDALSLMDKLVSFDQGKLRYETVLENLNVLDHDYFFRLGENFINSDSTAVMLLLDEILSRGFEESILVEGLLRHYRNLLVARDPASVPLLDGIDRVKERYVKEAAELSLDFILSAMQILGDALVKLKNSQNKRLLLETKLVKLTYLADLLEVSENQALQSKTENFLVPRPRKFRPGKNLAKAENTLQIETNISDKESAEKESEEAKKDLPDAKKTKGKKPQIAENSSAEEEKKSAKVLLLSKLKAKKKEASDSNSLDEMQKNRKELNQKNITECWSTFVEAQRDSATPNVISLLEQVRLQPHAEDQVGVKSSSKSALSNFKEKEMNQKILEHFRDFLSIPHVMFDYELENHDSEDQKEEYKSKFEIFDEMQEKNPKLKELKRKIGLEPF